MQTEVRPIALHIIADNSARATVPSFQQVGLWLVYYFRLMCTKGLILCSYRDHTGT